MYKYIIGNHCLKGLHVAKMIYFLAPAQTNRMQTILVSYEAPFRSSLQKNTGPVGARAVAGTIK